MEEGLRLLRIVESVVEEGEEGQDLDLDPGLDLVLGIAKDLGQGLNHDLDPVLE